MWIPRVYDGRNKTFFYFNWGQSKRRYGVGATTYTMPIEEFKQGNFSRLLGPVVGTDALGRPVREGQIYDPGTTRPDGLGGFIRDPFDGNIIPSGRFSQVSQNFQSYYPTLPAGAPLVNNYLTSGGSGAQDEDYWDIKIDQQIGKNRFAGKFWRSFNETANPFNLPEIFAIRTSSFSRGSHGRFNWTRPISARWVNDFAFGIDRDFLSTSSPGDAGIGASLIGQPNALGRCLPTIQIAGVFSTTQTELKCGQNEADTNWRFTNNTSYSAGKHLIKFGGIYNSWAANFPIENNALFSFRSPESALPGQFLTSTGYSYASFLLGGVDSAAAKGAEDQTPRMYTVGVYVQDSWRVRPNLTLQLGLRWDVQPFPVHWKDTISQFDATVPNPGAGGRLGALTYAGTGPGRIGKRRLAPHRVHQLRAPHRFCIPGREQDRHSRELGTLLRTHQSDDGGLRGGNPAGLLPDFQPRLSGWVLCAIQLGPGFSAARIHRTDLHTRFGQRKRHIVFRPGCRPGASYPDGALWRSA